MTLKRRSSHNPPAFTASGEQAAEIPLWKTRVLIQPHEFQKRRFKGAGDTTPYTTPYTYGMRFVINRGRGAGFYIPPAELDAPNLTGCCGLVRRTV